MRQEHRTVHTLKGGGELVVCSDWLSDPESEVWETLMSEIPWNQESFRMGGRVIKQPRLTAWVGDPDAVYRYSRRDFVPTPWTPTLRVLRRRLECVEHATINSVLCNLYRDGRDSMGAHADDEPELGPDPAIYSLSLGATRRIRFWHTEREEPSFALDLTHGSLLIMRGTTQRYWRHGLAKTKRNVGPRINLTFRQFLRARTAKAGAS